MRRSRYLLGLGIAACLGVGFAFLAHQEPTAAHAGPPVATSVPVPRVALIAGVPGSSSTDILSVAPGSSDPPQRIGSITHVPEAAVRGAVLPGSSAVLVVADTAPDRDPSWAASLIAVEAGQPARTLCDRVCHATRPLVTAAGQVFVQRGRAGQIAIGPDGKARMRVDELTIDEVDPKSGATRVVHAWTGYLTQLAGATDDELIVYRVGPSGADLMGIGIATGQVRTILASWPAFARDFSIDPGSQTLVAQQRGGAPPDTWVVERVELPTGKVSVAASSRSLDMVPYAWPGGGILVNPEHRRGPEVIGSSLQLPPVSDAGVLWIRARSADGAWLAGLAASPGKLPSGVVIRVSDGRLVKLERVGAARLDIVGFLGGAS